MRQTRSVPDRPSVRRAVFGLDAERCRQFLATIEYVESWHWHIDPDMFRIDLDGLAAVKQRFPADTDGLPAAGSVSFSYEELFALETVVFAADVYSHRQGQPPVDGVSDRQFGELTAWLGEALRWFVADGAPPTG